MFIFIICYGYLLILHSFPTRRSSDLASRRKTRRGPVPSLPGGGRANRELRWPRGPRRSRLRIDAQPESRSRSASGCARSEEHTSELQSLRQLVCRLLLEKKIMEKKGI